MLNIPQNTLNKLIELAENTIKTGTNSQILAFFAFDKDEPRDAVAFKFKYWAYKVYPRYFQSPPADFHDLFVYNMLAAYYGEHNYLNLGFRGCAKTTYTKLFLVYAILNDAEHTRKYIKVLARNFGNSKQMVTDIFNMMIEAKPLYGNVLYKEKDMKREETMAAFTTVDGVKLMAGTIGMTQRGHLQDAYRPDFLVFDDVEDRESISSLATTESTIWRIDEAIQGLSADGSYMVNGNYISEEGVIQWFLNKPNIVADKIAILDENGEPTWPDRYSKEKVELIKGDADDFYGEYLCLHPDTLILTPDGYKPISKIEEGDIVITHEEDEQMVLQVFEHDAEDLIDITVNGVVTTITKNHPVLTNNGWVKAGELTTDDLVGVIHHGKLD